MWKDIEMFIRFAKNNEAAASIEYAIVACLISVAAMAGYRSLGQGVSDFWQSLADGLMAAL